MLSRILTWSTLVAGLVAPYPPIHAASPPTVEQLAARPQFGRASLAPDGKHIAIAKLDERGSSLLIVDADTLQPTTELSFPPHQHVLGFNWVNDEMLVVTRGRRQLGVNAPAYTGELFAVSVDGKQRSMLFGVNAANKNRNRRQSPDLALGAVISILPNDPEHILVAETRWEHWSSVDFKPKVLKINVYTAAREQLTEVPLQSPRVIADRQGQVRFAYGLDDERRMRTLRFSPKQASWQPVELGQSLQGSLRPIMFSADNRSFYATYSEHGEPGCLYRFDAESYQRQRLSCDSQAELAYLMPTAEPGIPLAAMYLASSPKALLLAKDRPEAAIYRSLVGLYAPAMLDMLGFSRDGQRALIRLWGDREPGRVYLYDAKSQQSRLLFNAYPELKDSLLGPTHPFSMAARDGLLLHGFVTLPANTAPKQLPLVVMPHGGPYGIRDDWDFDAQAQLLASQGYAVLKVNFRGSGGFGELFVRQGYRQWGGAIQDDIIDATRWAVQQGLADPDRICIMGASFGAYSALMSAMREPELYRCAIGAAGVYDLDMMFQRGDIKKTKSGNAYLEEVLGSDEAELARQSPVAQVDKLQAKVLLLHGEADGRAPLAHAKALAKALEQAGKQHQLLVFDNEGHGFYSQKSRIRYFNELLRFLAAELAVEGSASSAKD